MNNLKYIPFEWANKVLGTRWKFTEEQTRDIYKPVTLAWDNGII